MKGWLISTVVFDAWSRAADRPDKEMEADKEMDGVFTRGKEIRSPLESMGFSFMKRATQTRCSVEKFHL